MTHQDLHIGRSFPGGGAPLEDACPCPQEPCGLVARSRIHPDCPQHPFIARKTIRQNHTDGDCPGGGERSDVSVREHRERVGADVERAAHSDAQGQREQLRHRLAQIIHVRTCEECQAELDDGAPVGAFAAADAVLAILDEELEKLSNTVSERRSLLARAEQERDEWESNASDAEARADAAKRRAERAEAERDRLRAENYLLRRPMAKYTEDGELVPGWLPIDAGRYAELEDAEQHVEQAEAEREELRAQLAASSQNEVKLTAEAAARETHADTCHGCGNHKRCETQHEAETLAGKLEELAVDRIDRVEQLLADNEDETNLAPRRDEATVKVWEVRAAIRGDLARDSEGRRYIDTTGATL